MRFLPQEQPAKVYMAGKIYKNDWRHDLLDLRNKSDWEDSSNWQCFWFTLNTGKTKPRTAYEFVEPYSVPHDKAFIYTGPWFVGCDHGCYHDANTHGTITSYVSVPVNDRGDTNVFQCWGGASLSRRKVVQLCTEAIDSADIVFAWIESLTAYGTLWELGYARAKGCSIYIGIDNRLHDDHENLWFALNLCDAWGFYYNAVEAFDTLVVGDMFPGKWYNDGKYGGGKVRRVNRIAE